MFSMARSGDGKNPPPKGKKNPGFHRGARVATDRPAHPYHAGMPPLYVCDHIDKVIDAMARGEPPVRAAAEYEREGEILKPLYWAYEWRDRIWHVQYGAGGEVTSCYPAERGRPSETPGRKDKEFFVQLLRQGWGFHRASIAMSYDYRTVRRAMEDDPDFAAAVRGATRETEEGCGHVLYEAAMAGDTKAAGVFLQQRAAGRQLRILEKGRDRGRDLKEREVVVRELGAGVTKPADRAEIACLSQAEQDRYVDLYTRLVAGDEEGTEGERRDWRRLVAKIDRHMRSAGG
jgi:hypothetical protein